MKTKKIIKDIVKLGVVSGIAYLAYRIGESSGRINEKFRESCGDDEETINSCDYDEPDDGCVAPADRSEPIRTKEALKELASIEESSPEQKHNFAPLSSITTVSANRIKNLLLYSISKKYISNKFIRERLDVDYEKAAEILAEFQQAGYIGDEMGNYRYPVNLAFRDLGELIRDS